MEAPPLERRLVAILAADVAGYSRLMGIDEEGTLATLSAFRSVTDGLIARHGGRICGTAGDSILAAFGSALAAVQCAIDIQKEFAASNDALEEDRRMQFRIGVNVGDVMVKEGDIFGDGVNIAARLEGLSEPAGSAYREASTITSQKSCLTISRTSVSRVSRTLLSLFVFFA
jgi:adenylate cyclase